MKRCSILLIIGLPLWLSWQIIFLQCGTPEFNPWVGKTPWRRERLPTPVFWPGEFHGLYSPCSCKESDTTEQLFHFQKIPGFKASQCTHGKDMQIHWLGCQVLPREPQPTWTHSSPILRHRYFHRSSLRPGLPSFIVMSVETPFTTPSLTS